MQVRLDPVTAPPTPPRDSQVGVGRPNTGSYCKGTLAWCHTSYEDFLCHALPDSMLMCSRANILRPREVKSVARHHTARGERAAFELRMIQFDVQSLWHPDVGIPREPVSRA